MCPLRSVLKATTDLALQKTILHTSALLQVSDGVKVSEIHQASAWSHVLVYYFEADCWKRPSLLLHHEKKKFYIPHRSWAFKVEEHKCQNSRLSRSSTGSQNTSWKQPNGGVSLIFGPSCVCRPPLQFWILLLYSQFALALSKRQRLFRSQ